MKADKAKISSCVL